MRDIIMTHPFMQIAREGLWQRNPALVQLLGLCPLLAVSSTLAHALGLGLGTLIVLTGSALSVSLVRALIPDAVRLPAFVLIIACWTTVVMLLMQAWAFALYQLLALFIQIIVTNCIILGRMEACASRQPPLIAAFDGLMVGAGFMLALIGLGSLRELIGHGTLLANMELLFGPGAANWTLTLPGYQGFLLAALPPGAFICLGLLIALYNWLEQPAGRSIRRKIAKTARRSAMNRSQAGGNLCSLAGGQSGT